MNALRRASWMLPCTLLCGGLALAAGHSATSTYDPTPDQPNSNDECTITFSSPGDSDQNKADVAAVKKAFDDAMAGSDDMRKKVQDACGKHGKALTVNVKRDDPGEAIASTPCDGTASVDVGDIDKITDNLSGKPADKAKVAANFLAEVLAHETDHNRHQPPDDHLDPAIDSGQTGKPVDDENAVMDDLKAGVKRNQYSYTGADGKLKTDFTVDKQKVVLDVSAYLADNAKVVKAESPQGFAVDPATIGGIPDAPCSTGTLPCYRDVLDGSPPLYLGDLDLDGVDDVTLFGPLDNCPHLANPQQADSDLDGLGQGCDPDDDNDGWDGRLEGATGSSDMGVGSWPEHATHPAACRDGIDNDRDGIVDEADQSCHTLPPETVVFPSPVPVTAVYPLPLRVDRGGVPEGTDVLPVRLQWVVNVYSAGLETWDLSGTMVVDRTPPADRDGDARREIETEIVALDLTGHSPSQGPVRVRVQAERQSAGLAEDLDGLGSGDYPAESFFDVFFSVDTPEPGEWTNDLPDRYRGIVDRWPPFGHIYNRALGPPMLLFGDAHEPRAEVTEGSFLVRIPDSDLDGGPDYADNCPFLPNPGQEDLDADAVGDPCDLCPFVFDPEQEDRDADGLGDACDADLDGDGFENVIDCAPFNPLAALPPVEVVGLGVARDGPGALVRWGPAAGPLLRDSYDLLSGDVGELRASGAYDTARLDCLASRAWARYAYDSRTGPAPGEAAFYLVRARNACGVGTYGDSGLVPDPRDGLDLDPERPCAR